MKRSIHIIIIALALSLLSGCARRADPIPLPPDDAVTAIEVQTIDGTSLTLTDAGQLRSVLSTLRDARPTRRQSVNDQPANADAFGTLRIRAAGETTVAYYYDRSGRHFVELPYTGIYALSESPETLLLQQ